MNPLTAYRPARRPLSRRVAASLAGFALAGAVLAGCGGEGSDVSCSLDACTVTFERGTDAEASILGVEARLVGVQNNQVTVEVAGQQVTLPVDGQGDVGDFEVAVQEVTADNVVVKISRAN